MSSSSSPTNSPARWYEIKALASANEAAESAAEIYIYGNIGDRWNEDGVIASDLVRDIAALDVANIHLREDAYDITGRVNGPKRLKLAERKAATARAWKVLSR